MTGQSVVQTDGTIEICGLGSEETGPEPERVLSLVTAQDPPRSYGGRA
jgi:hypothetical protein